MSQSILYTEDALDFFEKKNAGIKKELDFALSIVLYSQEVKREALRHDCKRVCLAVDKEVKNVYIGEVGGFSTNKIPPDSTCYCKIYTILNCYLTTSIISNIYLDTIKSLLKKIQSLTSGLFNPLTIIAAVDLNKLNFNDSSQEMEDIMNLISLAEKYPELEDKILHIIKQ